ncbi:hypothetical protein GQ53DRAFT_743954 [Thozetella sp. PMI_491]|nr:hypothetical protein GQ53DRAFT_743954 [Thozetella sp. PMI_491]
MPIGQFAAKYNATLALSLLWSSVGGGAGSLGVFKDVMTLTVLQSFSASYIKVYMGLIPYYHIQGGNQRLFDAIAALLRDDVLLNTVVTSAKRDDTGVSLVVSGPNGTRKIEAKKLLFAIPPTRENLAPFDLNADETLHFSKPKYGRYHTGVVSHSALTKGVVFQNTPAIAVQDSSAPFLNAPFVLDFNSYGNDTNLFSIGTSGSNYTEYTPEAAAALAQKNIETMAKAGTLPNLNGEKLKVVDWSDHGPGGYSVSPAQMQAGWMSDMYGLQGKRSTWFTGNAIAIDFSTMLWKFNDDLIPRILKSW